MKTIFVSEFLCSGAWPDDILPHSLMTEGRLMLESLCEDITQAGDYKLYTTRDQRVSLRSIPGLEVVDVTSCDQEWEMFQKLARQCDETILIAPELDGLLCSRIEWLEQNSLNRLMPSAKATRVCADKWQFYQFCQLHKIPTPSTLQFQDDQMKNGSFPLPYPFVIKPQFGAGTTMTAIIERDEDWSQFLSRRGTENDFPPYLLQPFLPGKPVSLACFISPDGNGIAWCPMAEQIFDKLEYRGGIIPCETERAAQARNIAERFVEKLPGLRGYLGFDFLLLSEAESPVQLLEVNSRLTSSYLGYRALAEESLAARLIDSNRNEPIIWSEKKVQFDTRGDLRFLN